MPQLGETVTEGTITKWYKAVGDQVARDEPLFEVSTDKVDSEVPSPAAGVLTEILVEEGDTVDVGAKLAVIGGEASPNGDSPPAATASAPGTGAVTEVTESGGGPDGGTATGPADAGSEDGAGPRVTGRADAAGRTGTTAPPASAPSRTHRRPPLCRAGRVGWCCRPSCADC